MINAYLGQQNIVNAGEFNYSLGDMSGWCLVPMFGTPNLTSKFGTHL